VLIFRTGDRVCVLLGYASSILLRPKRDGTFAVVGEAYLQDLKDSQALLGPLPKGWKVQYGRVDKKSRCFYVNTSTGTKTFADPRLPPLVDWEPLKTIQEGVTSELAVQFQHKETREIIDFDPRLEWPALEKIGVALEDFRLV
jgi:hypothetical protein